MLAGIAVRGQRSNDVAQRGCVRGSCLWGVDFSVILTPVTDQPEEEVSLLPVVVDSNIFWRLLNILSMHRETTLTPIIKSLATSPKIIKSLDMIV